MKSTVACLSQTAQTINLRSMELAPEAGQVLVHVTACGICRGDLNEYTMTREEDKPFGHEAVGQVVACGHGVKQVAEGDWVVGLISPGFATYGLAPEAELFKVPADMSRTGALVEPLKCVTTVVRAAAVDFCDKVVVVGCGFMGLAAIAALHGGYPRELIAVDAFEHRRKIALELGATAAVDPAGDGVLEGLRRDKADVVIEFAGNCRAATAAATFVRTRGRLVVAGGRIPQADGGGLYDALYLGGVHHALCAPHVLPQSRR